MANISQIAYAMNMIFFFHGGYMNNDGKSSKAGFGFLTAFFLGLFGLIFMICWPAGSYERKTFLRGWMITFFVMLAIEIVMIILYYTWIINLIKVATTAFVI